MLGAKSIPYDIPTRWIDSLAFWWLHWPFRRQMSHLLFHLVLRWHIILVHCSYWTIIHLRHNSWFNMTLFLLVNYECPLLVFDYWSGTAKLSLGLGCGFIPCKALAGVHVSMTVLKGLANVVTVGDWLLVHASTRGSISFCLVTCNIIIVFIDCWIPDTKLNVQNLRVIHFQRFLFTLAICENWRLWLVYSHRSKI